MRMKGDPAREFMQRVWRLMHKERERKRERECEGGG